jgi:hypothetical protein
MEKMPDEEKRQWLQFKDGDRGAFAAIYERHILPLIAYGL